MQYRVRTPRPPLSHVVAHLWSLHDAPRHARERIFPTGTLELVINLEEDAFRIHDLTGDRCRRFRGAIVSGCYRTPFVIDTRAHASILGVHFRPGGAAGLLGVAPGDLADSHVGLEDLWGPDALELRERLCLARDMETRFDVLERALVARLRARPRRGAVTAALALLDVPGAAIGAVTRELGLSRRRFIEIFTEDVGMSPKRYARVCRFQRALALSERRPTPRWTELALASGYFDQAHLCREWAELAGSSPSEIRALRTTNVKDNHVPHGGVKSVQDGRDSRPYLAER